jgi:hypothetical protein
MNQTVLSRVRTFSAQHSLPDGMCGELAKTAVYIQNRLTTSADCNRTPLWALTGKRPSISHLREVGRGAIVYSSVDNKMHPKGKEMVFVGYDETNCLYRFLEKGTRSIIFSRDVSFLNSSSSPKSEETEEANFLMPMGFLTAYNIQWLPDYQRWKAAMDEEINSINAHKVWEKLPRMSNSKVLSSRWVLCKKGEPKDPIFKARFVVKGCLQIDGVNVADTFSPTPLKDTL